MKARHSEPRLLLHVSGKGGVMLNASGYYSLNDSRTSAANYVDEQGVLQSMDAAMPVYENGAVRFEPTAINLVLHSQNHSTWTAIGVPGIVSADKNYGLLTLDKISDDGADALNGYSQVIAFTGDAQKSISVFIKKGTATKSLIRLRDTTAGANLLSAEITWAGTTPVITMLAGTVEKSAVALADGVWRLHLLSTTGTAANTNQLEIYPATDDALDIAQTGDIYAGGWQAVNSNFASSYIQTAAATATRNLDALTVSRASFAPDTRAGIILMRIKTTADHGGAECKLLHADRYLGKLLIATSGGDIAINEYSGSTLLNTATASLGSWVAGDELLIAACYDVRAHMMSVHVKKNNEDWADSPNSVFNTGVLISADPYRFFQSYARSISLIGCKIFDGSLSLNDAQRWVKQRAQAEAL